MTPADTRPNRLSVLAVLTALLLVAASLAATIQRYRMPTDGWALVVDDSVSAQPVFAEQFLAVPGSPVAIQPNDTLLAIDGQSVGSSGANAIAPPAGWQAGGQLTYTLQRGGQTFQAVAPLVVRPLSAMPALLVRDVLDLLTQLLVTGLLVFIFLRRPGSLAAQALLVLAAVLFGVWLAGLVRDDVSSLIGPSLWLNLWRYFQTWVWAGWLFPTLVLFSLVFPRPKRFVARHTLLTAVGLYGLLPVLRLIFGEQWQVGWGLVAVLGVVALASLAHTLRRLRGDPVARAQTKWVLAALVAAAGYQAIFNGLLIIFPTTFVALGQQPGFAVLNWLSGNLLSTVLPLALAVAITRYHLFDIDIIIRRTLLYSALTALLAAVYFGSVVVLQDVFIALTGAARSELVTVISTLAIAALFVPLRRRVQAFIDRRFYRRKYNAARILAAFGATAREDVNLDELTGRLLAVVDETIEPASADVWLRGPAGGTRR